MICKCGKPIEIRIGLFGGFVAGCWDKSHDFVVITDWDWTNPKPIGVIEDLIPETGVECRTEAEAIKSWEAFFGKIQ